MKQESDLLITHMIQQTELDNTKPYYQLTITITISKNKLKEEKNFKRIS